MKGISAEELVRRHPRLFHMAEVGSWPGIERHGLLSTTALLDLFGLRGEEREALEARRRPRSVRIEHPLHGQAVIRDQQPMHDTGLLRCLEGGLTPTQWYRILNAQVFFWLDGERLERLLKARAYRNRRQTVLTVDTACLLSRHEARVRLCAINSGATLYKPQPRGRDSFMALADWTHKHGPRGDIVELTVQHSVPDLQACVLHVEERGGGLPTKVLLTR